MDPIEQLNLLHTELDDHAARLDARATEIQNRADNEPDLFKKEVLGLVSESLREQVNTGLDFMRELTVKVAEAIDAAGVADDAEPGLEPADAEKILEVLNEHLDMLSGLAANVGTDQASARAAIEQKVTRTRSVIELVEGLVLDDAPEDDDAGDAPS